MALTPYERETVINMNDEDDFAIVTTFQRTMITKLRKNKAAEEMDCPYIGGAMFKIPANLVSIRNPRASRKLTEAQRKEVANRLANSRKAK